ncbi:F-box domain-containing protein [Ditylenchus destructor]|nr:F-box domain-containing protein [Ditylenchus destructor]
MGALYIEMYMIHPQLFVNAPSRNALKADKEAVRDSVLHTILGECQNSLTSLGFHHVDMSYIQPWTIAQLAKFSLESIQFIGCKFPVAMNESLFIRTLSPSFNNLEILTITETELITDKIAITVAKKCPKLREFNVRGCRKITAVSAVAFCEGILLNHDANPMTLDLRNTSFKASELSRHLHNSHSLLHCGASWKAQSITLSIGFDRSALVLENTERHDLVIVIYV